MNRNIWFALAALLSLLLAMSCGEERNAPSVKETSPGKNLSAHVPSAPPQYVGGFQTAASRVVYWVEYLPGDYNRSGATDGQDVFPLAVRFNQTSNFAGNLSETPGNDCIDGNRDGVLNGLDLFTIAANFNSTVAGHNLYKSTDDGESWQQLGVTIPRKEPASFLCQDVGVAFDSLDYFDSAIYRVTATDGEEETAFSEVITEEEQEVTTRSASLTGNQQRVVSPYGIAVDVADDSVAEGGTLDISTLSYPTDGGIIPALGRAAVVEFDTAPDADYTMYLPYLPGDFTGIESDDLGLLVVTEDTKLPGVWQVIDPGEFNIISTGQGEGFISFASRARKMAFTLIDRGELRALTFGGPTTGDAPLDVKLSCFARGGTWPYTYTWSINGIDGTPTDEHRGTYSFDNPGTYVVVCTVNDDDGGEVTSNPVVIQVAGD